jgi:hypothetical protein
MDPAQMAEQTPLAAVGTIDVRLETLEASLAGGLRFSNSLGASNQRALLEQKALIYAVIELLVGKGTLHLHEVEARQQELLSALQQAGPAPKLYLVDAPDKYTAGDTSVIDCEKRYPLCHGACCKFWFSLSVQDLDERVVKWNYAQPYSIAQGGDGRCVHQDRGTFQCTIYDHRPHICRTYDCRQDKRIWLDFDNYVPNPALNQSEWPQVASEVSSAAGG